MSVTVSGREAFDVVDDLDGVTDAHRHGGGADKGRLKLLQSLPQHRRAVRVNHAVEHPHLGSGLFECRSEIGETKGRGGGFGDRVEGVDQ